MAVVVPAASAAITPTLTLTQSGTQAGSSVALTTDITFAPSPSSDSVKDLTEILPPGLLSNASIDGGACLKSPPPSSGLPPAKCEIGTGTATVVANGALTLSPTLSLYLVAPPQPSDLAGIVIYEQIGNGAETQLGSPGEVSVRPSGDPNGVGLDISFTNIPDSISFGGTPLSLSVKDLDTTITSIRLPTSCPSSGADYTIQADSYSDPTTKSTSQPLKVTGCSALKLTPTFTVTATRDTADTGVAVTTDLSQPAAMDQATSSTVVLTLPPDVLGPNASGVVSGGLLCADPTYATCVKVGTAMSTSPLYPSALQGSAYLTGTSLAAPSITLVFPPPFPITLSGAVDLATGSTTFTGVPDLPLTDLQVVLAGGPDSVFTPSCDPASGTASASLTSQNGDQTVTADAPFTVSNCPAPTPPGGGSTPPVTTPPVTTPTTSPTTSPLTPPASSPRQVGRPQLKSVKLSKLAHGRFLLRFGFAAGTNAPALKSVQLRLPAGLRLAPENGHRLGLRTRIFTRDARIGSVTLAHGRLVVTIRHTARHLVVSIRGLTVPALGHAATRHHRRRFKVVVSATDAAGTSTRFAARTLHVRVA